MGTNHEANQTIKWIPTSNIQPKYNIEIAIDIDIQICAMIAKAFLISNTFGMIDENASFYK